MALSRLTKRRKIFARLNLIGTTAIISKSWAPLAIETMAHKDKQVIYLYIDTQIGKQKLSKTLVDFGAVAELIS